jgi:hypothetical protein
MKKSILLGLILGLSVIVLLSSCQKEEEEIVPTTTTPALVVPPSLSATHTLSGTTVMDTMSTKSLIITVNNTGAPTTDRCTMYVQKFLPLGGIHFSEFLPQMEGIDVDNSNWRVTDQATRYMFISEPGYVITSNSRIGVALLSYSYFGGFSITSTIKSGTGGGETPNSDNITISHLKVE